MAKLTILKYPDPRLHTVAKPVAQVDARIRQLADDMLETMYEADGVGLGHAPPALLISTEVVVVAPV